MIEEPLPTSGSIRNLEDVLRELGPLAMQGKVEGFFNNIKNADKLGGLVESVRDAVMDYQVVIVRVNLRSRWLISISGSATTRHL